MRVTSNIIFNSLNGDSNVAFFKQLKGAGITPEQYPVMSVSIAEEEDPYLSLLLHCHDSVFCYINCSECWKC